MFRVGGITREVLPGKYAKPPDYFADDVVILHVVPRQLHELPSGLAQGIPSWR